VTGEARQGDKRKESSRKTAGDDLIRVWSVDGARRSDIVPTGAALGSCPLESPAGCAVDQRNDLCDKELDPDSEDLYTGAILGHFFLGV